MRLKDKTAIITGGARGIGKAIAATFLREGAKVAIFDLNEADANAFKQEFPQYADRIHFEQVNVTEYPLMEQAVGRVISKYGAVDVMICNAGITRDAMTHKMTEDQFDLVVDVNLKGAYNSARSVVDKMRDQNRGKIIFTSSVVGEYGNVGQANYAASKAGIIGMAKSMAKELARKNVCVNVVAPGYTNTEMMKTVPEKVLSGIRDKTPMGRLAEPDEIANAFLFLASDESNYITGHVLSVNGGLTL
ncbi:MAG: 3-oxoacyl-ACP reductase FabG [Candidatus Wallbacteria bacterium]|nr:3-oxoacyl-ACP reductase FabG [Candidatus Wallbacteria bacterium]